MAQARLDRQHVKLPFQLQNILGDGPTSDPAASLGKLPAQAGQGNARMVGDQPDDVSQPFFRVHLAH